MREPLYDKIDFINGFPISLYCKEKQDYYFAENDLKEISFLHDTGKFYIILYTNVIYQKQIQLDRSNKVCGIDLGIRNPVTLYDGNQFIVYKMSDDQLSKISRLEKRISRLQTILDNKYNVNGKNTSNNYYKLLYKIRVSWKDIFNIRLNWRRQVCNEISKNYGVFVIDSFYQPGKKSHEDLKIPKNIINNLNRNNRNHGMSYFYNVLVHDIEKNGGIIIEAPPNTTNKCSECGHINKTKLPLGKNTFKCEKCGYTIDRDKNAAINCYKYLL